MKGRIWGVVALLIVGIGLVIAAYFVHKVGVDNADKLASIGSFFLAGIGLLITIFSLVAGWNSVRTSQSVANSRVGGDLTQIKGVAAGVRIARTQQPGGREVSRPATPSPAARLQGEQIVSNSKITGDVTQIGDVGGDVQIDK